MRRALFPSEVAASTPIGLSVPRFPAPHTLAAFSIRPRIHFDRLPRLDCHTLPATTVRRSAAPIPSGQTGLDASRQAQFSAGIVILCGVRREPPTSAGSDPATGGTDQTRTGWPPDPKSGALPTALRLHIGGRWRCRSPRLSPRTVFETGSEAARIHLPYWLEVLHHARSGVEPDRLGTRTPLHLQG
jgi:hypothetical protein